MPFARRCGNRRRLYSGWSARINVDIGGVWAVYMMLGCLFVLCAVLRTVHFWQQRRLLMAYIALAAAKSMGGVALSVCDGGGDGGIRRLYDAGFIAGQYSGSGAGKL